jgi:NNP family nitrate/nitrite transporter-like MFS transporter
VGAGGNVGAVFYAQFLLRSELPLEDCFLYFGLAIIGIGMLGTSIRFSSEMEARVRGEFESSAQTRVVGVGGE